MYATFAKETQPKNTNDKTKNRIDQILFNPFNLISFIPMPH